jgi:uncharacterized protein (TIGR02646 family)
MIQLDSKILNTSEQVTLDTLQGQVNREIDFAKKVQKAQNLWNNKNGNQKSRTAFETIAGTLKSMCVYVGICNYCEQNEACDIEHVHPKSFFPENTFNWENYILACKQCNTGHKLDKGFVLNQQDDLIELKRNIAPPFNRIAFINIRTDNPEDFMLLNPLTQKFVILPGLTRENENKATATLSILELNERDTLVAARRSAARHYYEILERLTKILAVRKVETLKVLLTPYDDRFDLTLPLEQIKGEIKSDIKKYIQRYQHPSVWTTIKKVQSQTNEKWRELFRKLPDALNW